MPRYFAIVFDRDDPALVPYSEEIDALEMGLRAVSLGTIKYPMFLQHSDRHIGIVIK